MSLRLSIRPSGTHGKKKAHRRAASLTDQEVESVLSIRTLTATSSEYGGSLMLTSLGDSILQTSGSYCYCYTAKPADFSSAVRAA